MRRIGTVFSIITIALTLLLGEQSAPAIAAAPSAAGGSFTVGSCGKNAVPDLATAVSAANALPKSQHKTITVCPGTRQVMAPVGPILVAKGT